jgi:hypothetical protein
VLDKFEYLPIKCKVETARQNLLRYREELVSRSHSLKIKVYN